MNKFSIKEVLEQKTTFHRLLKLTKPKSVKVLTWGLGTDLDWTWLNHTKAQVIVGWYRPEETLEEYLERNQLPTRPFRQRKTHIKAWIFDNRVFVGSQNLCRETIPNLMVEVEGKQAKEVTRIFNALWRDEKVNDFILLK